LCNTINYHFRTLSKNPSFLKGKISKLRVRKTMWIAEGLKESLSQLDCQIRVRKLRKIRKMSTF